MPFPGEHACRLRQPGEFREGSFRRIRRGARHLIVGRLKGESTTTAQSMRFPKDDFTEAEARSACREAGGRFEAAAGGPAGDEPDPPLEEGAEAVVPPEFVPGHDHPEAKFEADAIRLQGDFAVVPVVMTKEGVQNGGLKLREELERTWKWMENRPVTDGHPPGPTVTLDHVRGVVRNVRFREEDAAIVGEAWVFVGDEAGRRLLDEIKGGSKSAVSVGFWFREDGRRGEFRGKPYRRIQRDLMWDHLAFVPEGACSKAAGCGVVL